MPQPIDPQTETARLSAVDRVQQIMDRASLAAQQRLAAHVESERVIAETVVQQTPQSQSEQVDAEARRRNPYAKRRKQRAPEDSDPDATPHGSDNEAAHMVYNAEERTERLDAEQAHRLDISI
ncbi:MAG TPA: hypothetical protein PLO62_12290 [Candidatus Hydrogenedentes bacterium]|nr:hypothetical protein [Candidatus Hydrogenedentota bacterium]